MLGRWRIFQLGTSLNPVESYGVGDRRRHASIGGEKNQYSTAPFYPHRFCNVLAFIVVSGVKNDVMRKYGLFFETGRARGGASFAAERNCRYFPGDRKVSMHSHGKHERTVAHAMNFCCANDYAFIMLCVRRICRRAQMSRSLSHVALLTTSRTKDVAHYIEKPSQPGNIRNIVAN